MSLFKTLFGGSTVSETISLQRQLLDFLPEILSGVEEEFWDGISDAIEEIRQDDSGDIEHRLLAFGVMIQHLTAAMGENAKNKIDAKREELVAKSKMEEEIDLSKVTLQ